jgi:hypothetical protein
LKIFSYVKEKGRRGGSNESLNKRKKKKKQEPFLVHPVGPGTCNRGVHEMRNEKQTFAIFSSENFIFIIPCICWQCLQADGSQQRPLVGMEGGKNAWQGGGAWGEFNFGKKLRRVGCIP